MNFLSGGCLAKSARIKFWTTPCCKDVIKVASATNDLPKTETCKQSTNVQLKLCPVNYRAVSFLTQFTQVRFKECPRLHRDIEYPNFDAYRKSEFKDVRKTGWGSGEEKPGVAYFISFFGLMISAYGAKSEMVHFLSSMSAAADVLAMASIEVDISNIAPGACLTFKWRGKPLFVKHRTSADIEGEANTPMSALRDPQTPEERTVKQEWLVVIGICTHLGCVPIPNSGDWAGGFYCPCHGSHYDNVGRTRKGPAPLNLEVPPHKFLSDTLVLVG